MFRGVGFSVGRDGPELYLKTIERLGLYVSKQFKNGSNVKKCLIQEKFVKQELPDLAGNHTTAMRKEYGNIMCRTYSRLNAC